MAKSKSYKSVQQKSCQIDYKKLSAWQLRRLGYTVEQTAQILEVGTTTVSVWDKEVDKYFQELPAVRLAVDYVKTMIPSALAVYERTLKGPDIRLAKETAKDILNTFSIISDKKEFVIDDKRKDDNDLIAEAERYIAQRQQQIVTNSPGTEEA
jgi:hypothetical protein